MTTIIGNATIVTGNPGRAILYDAALAVQDDRIAAIGATAEIAAKYPEAETVDASRMAIFPGLINCHTHLLATADRGILEDFGFPTTLKFPTTTRSLLSTDERKVMALLGVAEAIRSGTTTVLEISAGLADYAEDLVKTGLRWGLAENFNDIDDAKLRDNRFEYVESKREAGLQRSADLIEKWHGYDNGRVSCFVAPHAPELCSPELFQKSRELADRYQIGSTTHLSQSYQEIEAVMRTRGVPPTQYLFANDFLSSRLVLAHCRYLEPSEIALLGHAGAGISNNAAIAARRGAAAPIKELEAAGCVIGMGSDNMAEDMVEVMRAGLFQERVRRNDEMEPQPEEVLEWATRGSARILGLDQDVGSLEVGKKADLFLVDLMRPHLVPTLRVVSSFVHNGQPADITSVMVNGEWVMREGKVLTIDEADIVQRAERIGHSVWRRLTEQFPDVPFPVKLPPHSLT